MYRRDFLKGLGMLPTILVIPSTMYTHNPLRYPLVSTPDMGTEVDQEKAEKARKVAEYIITRKRQKGLLYYNPQFRDQGLCQSVQAKMEINNWEHIVMVINNNKKAEVKIPDSINIGIQPVNTYENEKQITLSDKGLDGICDFGIIPKGLNKNGQKIVYHAKSIDTPNGENLEYNSLFQSLYENVLSKVLQFYEKK